ncbi:rod-binding protein [Lachnospiraceae bacterium ZAX-1]
MSISIDSLGNLGGYANGTTELSKANALEGTLSSDLSKATDDELMDVCREFEAYFTEQMFKAMQKMVPESDNEMSASSKQLQDYYKEEMIKGYADTSAQGTGLGLAQTLFEQMKRNYGL